MYGECVCAKETDADVAVAWCGGVGWSMSQSRCTKCQGSLNFVGVVLMVLAMLLVLVVWWYVSIRPLRVKDGDSGSGLVRLRSNESTSLHRLAKTQVERMLKDTHLKVSLKVVIRYASSMRSSSMRVQALPLESP